MMNRTVAALAGGILAASLAWAGQPGAPGAGVASQAGPQGGRGDGRGMMGGGDQGGMMGHGGGPGMMMGGFGWRDIPDLTADQRSKIDAIRRDLRNRQLTLMDQMHDQWQATPYNRSGQLDEQAARRAYDASEKLHRQMFDNMLDAQKRIDALLTPAQRQQLARRYGAQ
jgi:Spy/CpxP family protein refolding chaperone